MKSCSLGRRLAGVLLLAGLGACGILELTPEDQITLYVAPSTVECQGVGPQRCLRVKQHPGEEWQLFFGSIAGFAFEPGFFYELRVARRRIPDPPADGSRLGYRLLRMVNKQPADAVH